MKSSATSTFLSARRPTIGMEDIVLVTICSPRASCCLDARTGERVWHFQIVHHGVWDYDLPAAPNLVDIEVDGRSIKAVAQITKQGFVYVFDRVTGEPVWPIEERPVPQSTVPGEKTSPTQPFPSRPAPFEQQGLTEGDLIDFTPELRQAALDLVGAYDLGPLYSPPTQRGLIQMPGALGGANCTGAALDRSTNILYIPSLSKPYLVKVVPPGPGESDVSYWFELTRWLGLPERIAVLEATLWSCHCHRSRHRGARLAGATRRRPSEPSGASRSGPAAARVAQPRRATARRRSSVRRAVSESLLSYRFPGRRRRHRARARRNVPFHPSFYAFDKTSGELVWEMELPANVTGAPMTYLADGEQFIVFPIGGIFETSELIALALEK